MFNYCSAYLAPWAFSYRASLEIRFESRWFSTMLIMEAALSLLLLCTALQEGESIDSICLNTHIRREILQNLIRNCLFMLNRETFHGKSTRGCKNISNLDSTHSGHKFNITCGSTSSVQLVLKASTTTINTHNLKAMITWFDLTTQVCGANGQAGFRGDVNWALFLTTWEQVQTAGTAAAPCYRQVKTSGEGSEYRCDSPSLSRHKVGLWDLCEGPRLAG